MESLRILVPTFLSVFCTLLMINIIVASDSGVQGDDVRLIVFTVASDETDGYKRFRRSTDTYDLQVEVLGMHQEWKGGDIMNYPGGGYKLNLLKVALQKYKDEQDTVIMFSDSYDVIFTTGQEEIIKKFRSFNASLVFSAENYIWPDKSLQSDYPEVEKGYPFLCSGLYIGYAPYVYKAITYKEVADTDDDQLHFTKLFLNKETREEWPIKLDHLAQLFQNLNGARDDVKLRFEGRNSLLHNTKFNTVPVAVHGNGGAKIHLNNLGNYLVNMWSQAEGCMGCEEDTIRLPQDDLLPTVMLAIFIYVPTPFLDEFFQKIEALKYPKSKIDLFIYNGKMFHSDTVKAFVEKAKSEYRSVRPYYPEHSLTEGDARDRAVQYCLKEIDCEYYFNVDSDVQLGDINTLRILMEQNRPIIAPLVSKHGKLWTNFWGDLTHEGYYARSEDYLEIVKYKRRGVWNAAFISNIYLIKAEKLRAPNTPSFVQPGLDPDMAMCQSFRDKGVFMYVDNQHDFGHLVTTDYYETTHKHNDLWEIYNNRADWEAKYIHPEYYKQLEEGVKVDEPCPDVYQFPIVTETYTKQLIEEMEFYGKWSSGNNEDARLDGGYENVPTRDIHMKQVNYEKHWLYFLKEFVAPMAEKVYPGYYSKAYALMNFVVRYRPDEQPKLRPHHDSSTYTINMALNKYNEDYKGGGAHFIRYNCSCIGLPAGYTIMHPGRLTHYHEGLETTWGTRYIMVSFIDP